MIIRPSWASLGFIRIEVKNLGGSICINLFRSAVSEIVALLTSKRSIHHFFITVYEVYMIIQPNIFVQISKYIKIKSI